MRKAQIERINLPVKSLDSGQYRSFIKGKIKFDLNMFWYFEYSVDVINLKSYEICCVKLRYITLKRNVKIEYFI